MDAITYALTAIRRNIPVALLEAGLNIDIPPDARYITSLDEKIVTRIIRGIVLMDSNVINGIEMIISLDGVQYKQDNYFNGIFHVPFERTNGRYIINVLGVGSIAMTGANGYLGGMPQLPVSGTGGGSCCFNPTYMSNQANRIYNSHKGTFSDYNPNCSLIGPNTILVAGMRFFSGNSLGARVNIENDDNFNNLSPKSFRFLGEACVLATKAYLYNKLIIEMGSGYLQGGQELGPFMSTVERYDSAMEDYNTFLTEIWGKVLFQNDQMKKNKFIQSMLNTNF